MTEHYAELEERAPPQRRSTSEIIALVFTVTVALVIVVATVGVAVLIQDDSTDAPTNAILSALGSAVSTLMGALLVILAGRRRSDV
jgi:uncharacterized membrane protein (DUF4010 family)